MCSACLTNPTWMELGLGEQGKEVTAGQPPHAHLYSVTAHVPCQLCGKQLLQWQITGPNGFILLKSSPNKTYKRSLIFLN